MTQPQAIPLLTEVVPDTTDDLPVLTDIAQETPPAPAATEPALLLIMQQQLEAHIDTVFAEKLQTHLAAAQRQAVEQAIAEMKNELPQLIRAALAQAAADH
ncbi:MAG: hypothetical protein Q8O64_13025 [Sideroxyarcus sp.]|nr:hypothetical protein [Sideroxyarcus sp.]